MNRVIFIRLRCIARGFLLIRWLVVFFKGPKSFTGEDGFEVYAHGGLAVMSKIVEAFTDLGFKKPGQVNSPKGHSLTTKYL